MRPPHLTRTALTVLGASALALPFLSSAALASPVSGATTAGNVPVPGSAPAWVRTAHVDGTPAASSRLTFNVALPLRNQAQVNQLAQAVSDPHSPSYGKYLTASQFNARFAPTSAQIAKVSSFLRSRDITIIGDGLGDRWVTASATVAQVEKAFDTTLKTYTYKGHRLRAATRELSVPSSVRSLIAGFSGVTQTIVRPASKPVAESSAKPSATQPPAAACSVFWDQHEQVAPSAYGRTSFPTPNCGYSPTQLQTAYGVRSAEATGDNGSGVTVAIVDAYDSPTILADANAFSTLQGLPQFAPGQFTDDSADPSTFNDQAECGGEAGWNEEQTLDVEAVHGLAPGANIEYVGGQNCDTGIDTSLNFIVQHRSADEVSNSYGDLGEDDLGDEVTIEHSIFLQGAIEGIGFYFSTGDDGDNVLAGTPHPEADYPATDTEVTAVGGTSLGINSNSSYKFEVAWGNNIDSVNFATTPASYSVPPPGSFLFGTGGGTSELFRQPSWQKGIVPASLSQANGSTPMRVVPDVADVGDPETGYLICIHAANTGGVCQGASLAQIGGTSLACPVFAGIQALVQQGRHIPLGFADPALYKLPALVFHDVKPSNAPFTPLAMVTDSGRSLLTMDSDSSLHAAPGFDNTTGRGTPNGALFLLAERFVH
jgi:subtilase family serine protease